MRVGHRSSLLKDDLFSAEFLYLAVVLLGAVCPENCLLLSCSSYGLFAAALGICPWFGAGRS